MHQETTHNLYRVKVGHFEIIVKAASAEDAIAFARRKLTLDMPLFYDIIRGLETARFEVRPTAA